MAGGRPTKYTRKLADKICTEVALGNSLRKTCEARDVPTIKTIYNWFSKHEEFLQQYTRAKRESGDSDADKIEEIAEKVLSGEYEPAAARVAIDAFKWTASKKIPKKYSDKMINEHTGTVNLTNLSDDELEAKTREAEQAFKQSTQD